MLFPDQPWEMQQDVDREVLQLQSFFAALGPLPCTLTTVSGAMLRNHASEVIAEWLDSSTSNTLVLSGTYGAGKSYLMSHLTALAKRAALSIDYTKDPIPAAEQVSASTVVLVDHFDSLTLATGTQNGPPDLRDVRHLLPTGTKIAIATSRALNDKGHELVRQLRFRARREALGVRDPYLVELLPWPIERILVASQKLDADRSDLLHSVLASVPPEQSLDLRRPLALTMLLDVLANLPAGWIPELGDVYDQFMEHLLSHDYDSGRSLISASIKQAVLSNLAYDIFSGRTSHLFRVGNLANLPLQLISQRLEENLVGANRRLSGIAGYDPARDFLDTNRVLELVPSSAETEYRFRTAVFYEYFLGSAIISRYAAGNPLAIDGDRFSPATFDSLVLSVARRQLTPKSIAAIQDLLGDPDLEWPDRMLMLYLVEDSPEYLSLLRSSPEEYFAHVALAANQNQWHFLAKMAKFQMVCLGRLTAMDYLNYVDNAEQPKDRAVELQLARNLQGNIPYLLSRLRNPGLASSAPITIYRIAQIDPSLAETALENDAPSDVHIREACRRALDMGRGGTAQAVQLDPPAKP